MISRNVDWNRADPFEDRLQLVNETGYSGRHHDIYLRSPVFAAYFEYTIKQSQNV